MYIVGFLLIGIGILVAALAGGNAAALLVGVAVAAVGLLVTGFKYYFL